MRGAVGGREAGRTCVRRGGISAWGSSVTCGFHDEASVCQVASVSASLGLSGAAVAVCVSAGAGKRRRHIGRCRCRCRLWRGRRHTGSRERWRRRCRLGGRFGWWSRCRFGGREGSLLAGLGWRFRRRSLGGCWLILGRFDRGGRARRPIGGADRQRRRLHRNHDRCLEMVQATQGLGPPQSRGDERMQADRQGKSCRRHAPGLRPDETVVGHGPRVLRPGRRLGQPHRRSPERRQRCWWKLKLTGSWNVWRSPVMSAGSGG